MVLTWEGAYGKAFQVQLSDNGTTWRPQRRSPTAPAAARRSSATGTGRYLRLNLQTRATGYGFSLWEVAVHTTGGGTTDPGTGGGNGGLTGHGDVVGPADGKVRIIGSQGSWTLAVNGKKWVTKGMTWGPAISEFPANVANFKELGVNTIRTWGTDAGSKALFDAAATARHPRGRRLLARPRRRSRLGRLPELRHRHRVQDQREERHRHLGQRATRTTRAC